MKVTDASRTGLPGHAYFSLKRAGISVNDLPEVISTKVAILTLKGDLNSDGVTDVGDVMAITAVA